MTHESGDASKPLPAGAPATAPQEVAIPELVAEVYRDARPTLRRRMLEYMLRPLGPLAFVAVAAGAFGSILQRGGYRELAVAPEDAARISPEHMQELARYLEQAHPESLLHLAPILDGSSHPGTTAGLAASILLLALQAWRGRLGGG